MLRRMINGGHLHANLSFCSITSKVTFCWTVSLNWPLRYNFLKKRIALWSMAYPWCAKFILGLINVYIYLIKTYMRRWHCGSECHHKISAWRVRCQLWFVLFFQVSKGSCVKMWHKTQKNLRNIKLWGFFDLETYFLLKVHL